MSVMSEPIPLVLFGLVPTGDERLDRRLVERAKEIEAESDPDERARLIMRILDGKDTLNLYRIANRQRLEIMELRRTNQDILQKLVTLEAMIRRDG